MGDTPRIILASASPRRRVLLAGTGLEFEVRPAGVDEDLAPGFAPEQAAETLALRKARAGLLDCGPGECLIIGSDTIVAIGEGPSAQQLGKPADAAEALAMLAALSGTRHQVVTGVAVVRSRDQAQITAHERTWVSMRELGEDEMRAYVDSGEWQDKAGGYAIQETADRFVTGLEGGGWDNVVGLPVALSMELLASLGGQDLADPRSSR